MQQEIFIVGASRTPMAAFQGVFSEVPAWKLGAKVIQSAIHQSSLDPKLVNELLMGNCLMAGQGQAPARQAALAAGLPASCGAVTLSKMCGSGMKAVMLACDMLSSGSAKVMIAGGMENMTRAPYLIPRVGFRMGHGQIYDHMMLDGLEDAYQKGRAMGTYGEECAAHYGFTRTMQDAYAIESLQRARHAIESGAFSREITPVLVQGRKEDVLITQDESPLKMHIEKIPTLKPAFLKNGTITSASSSSINDGAAALLLTTAALAKQHGAAPLARIIGHDFYAQEPNWFTTSPIYASRQLLSKIHWSVDDVDLWEVNEAFAVVPMAFMQEMDVPHHRVNVFGGACSLGHPIGASGARILVTLMNALSTKKLKRGVATLCIGGGEATALAIEMMV